MKHLLVPDDNGFVSQTVPVVSSQSVSGTIVAKGVRREKERVPLLGDVPLISVLFQRRNDVPTRRELVIMVRPYVLGAPAESEHASRAVDADRRATARARRGHGRAARAQPRLGALELASDRPELATDSAGAIEVEADQERLARAR